MNCDKTVQIHVSRNFPEIVWRASKPLGDSYLVCLFLGSRRGTAWRYEPDR